MEELEKCGCCNENEAMPLHKCPYKDYLAGDESPCNCCYACKAECEDEV